MLDLTHVFEQISEGARAARFAYFTRSQIDWDELTSEIVALMPTGAIGCHTGEPGTVVFCYSWHDNYRHEVKITYAVDRLLSFPRSELARLIADKLTNFKGSRDENQRVG